MKLNWGVSIAIFYTLFVIVMVSMVIKSSQNNVHLVQENYYQKDLDYENFRASRQNSAELATPVSIEYSSHKNTVDLAFPKDMKDLKGKLTFFRPSNKYLDKTFELKLDEDAKMSIPIDQDISKGLWRLQINWEAKGSKFYKEETIVI